MPINLKKRSILISTYEYNSGFNFISLLVNYLVAKTIKDIQADLSVASKIKKVTQVIFYGYLIAFPYLVFKNYSCVTAQAYMLE